MGEAFDLGDGFEVVFWNFEVGKFFAVFGEFEGSLGVVDGQFQPFIRSLLIFFRFFLFLLLPFPLLLFLTILSLLTQLLHLIRHGIFAYNSLTVQQSNDPPAMIFILIKRRILRRHNHRQVQQRKIHQKIRRVEPIAKKILLKFLLQFWAVHPFLQ